MDEHYGTVNDIENSPTNLEMAYESLLANRNINFINSKVEEKSEEEILCTTNLQTAHLLETLNKKAADLHRCIESVVECEKALEDAPIKLRHSHSSLMTLSVKYDIESVDTLQTKYVELANEYSRIHGNIKKELYEQKRKYEAELDATMVNLNSLRTLIRKSIEDIIKPDDMVKKMCPVCYEREVCMVMVPCGHTYCDACSRYDYRAKCPQCRSMINTRVKMYFSI